MQKYIWKKEILKATEGGEGTAVLKRALSKRFGGKVTTYPSCYVGHTTVQVVMNKKEDMLKALRTLKLYGYIKSIKEGLSGID